MRTALTAALLMSLVVAVPPAHAEGETYLADFIGFDWTWPIPSCLDCPAQYYEAQGTIPSENPAFLNFDHVNNEYTFVLGTDLFFADADTFGTTVVSYYVNGDIQFVEDSKTTGTAATYDLDDACDPFYDRLTFADGVVVLSGEFTQFVIVNDTSTGDGNFEGLTTWNGGTQLGNIPVSQRSGWTFGAFGFTTPGNTPCGYHWQLDGEAYLEKPVPTIRTTWGSIKASGR